MKSLQMLSFKELTFILFYLFVLIEKSDSTSFTIGSYPNNLEYGINDDNCGVTTTNYIHVEISLDYMQCFKKRHPPQKLLVKNEDIFHSVKPKERIFGGTEANILSAPWAVIIYYLNTTNNTPVLCDGVLVTLEWVLTMARCNPKKENNRKIYAGSHIALKGVERQSVLWKPANLFKRERVGWDLALVKLNKPYNRILDKNKYTLNPLCLPKRGQVNKGPEKAEFFAWGEVDEKGTRPSNLRKTDILLQGTSDAVCGYPHLLCANYTKGTDTPRPCYRDRGAGLVQYDKGKNGEKQAVLAGIFLDTEKNLVYRPIHHEPCTQDITHAEFYRVSDIIGWILETIKNN